MKTQKKGATTHLSVAASLIIADPATFRANVCKTFFQAKFDSENILILRSTVRNLERSVFNWAIKDAKSRNVVVKWNHALFKQIYIDHLRTMVKNLTPKWMMAIKNGECAASDFAFLTHQELDTRWSARMHMQNMRKSSQFIDTQEADTDCFTCPRCYSIKCSHYLLQTRSSDEPMTIFVTCLKCGCKFRG